MDRETANQAGKADPGYARRLRNEPDSGRFVEPRSWLERTSDEVASWFGNVDAMRRRQRDEAVGDHRGLGPKNKIDDDARIVDEVSRHMTADVLLDASRVVVLCEAGVVTLNGDVTTGADRMRAEHLAAAVSGVAEVRNNLLVA